jgi:hypothetical protein
MARTPFKAEPRPGTAELPDAQGAGIFNPLGTMAIACFTMKDMKGMKIDQQGENNYAYHPAQRRDKCSIKLRANPFPIFVFFVIFVVNIKSI